MKTVFNFIFALLLTAFFVRASAAAEVSSLEKLAAVIDYVAADYPGAVQNGKVVAQTEYEEQLGLVEEANRLAREIPAPAGHEQASPLLLSNLGELQSLMKAKAAPLVIAERCRSMHRLLIDQYGLVLAPLGVPSEARAKTLFLQACAPCHGAEGRADTEKAKTLKPPPVSFFDVEKMSRISPSLAFHALTFGITGTQMAAFDTLPASNRWSLAFYAVSLRHRSAPKGGKEAFERAKVKLAPTATRLAELSDEQLETLLTAVPADQRPLIMGYLRTEAPFAEAPGGMFADARRLLAEVAHSADDADRARTLAVSAYLEGVEPHEAVLRAHDRALADRLERAFLDLRRTITSGASPDAVRREVARTVFVIDTVDEHLQEGKASVPFFAALAIALREGFELSLLIGALLAFLRRSGRQSLSRYVHFGWIAAIPAGLCTWFAVGAALSGARRELTEAVLTLVAATMLLFVSNFVLGKMESRRWLKFLERRTREAAEDSGAHYRWPLVAVAFVAAYREAIEIVLFFRALVLDSPNGKGAIALGIAAGLLVLAVLVLVMQQLGRRLNPRPVMVASGILLTVLAVSLVGQGIRALQEGGYMSVHPLGIPNVPAIGFFATLEGLVVQLLVVALVLLPTWLQRRQRRHQRETPTVA